MSRYHRSGSRGRASWQDDDADTEKPHSAPQARTEDDGAQDKGSKMGWLRKQLGGGGGNKGKSNRSPPRRQEPPLPAPSQSPSFTPPVSPDPKNTSGAATMASLSPFKHLHLPQSLLPNVQSAPDPTLVADLEELRKEVKGLQEAFVSLKREHKELRGELSSRREAASKTASLPVDAVDFGKGKQATKGAGKGQDAGAGVGEMLSGPPQNAQESIRMLPPPVNVDAGNQEETVAGLFSELFNCCGVGDAKEKAGETASASYTQLGAGPQQSAASSAASGPPPPQSLQQQQQQHQQDLRNAAAWTQPVPPLLIGGAGRGSAAAGSAARSQLAGEKAPPPREPLMDAERRHHTRSESAGPVLSAASTEASAYTPGFGREGRSPSPTPSPVRPLSLGGASTGSALRRHPNDVDAAFTDEIAATSPWNSPRDVMRPVSAGGSAVSLGGHSAATYDQGDSQSSLGGRGISVDSEEAPNFGMRAGSAVSQARPPSAAAAGLQPGLRRPPPPKDESAGSAPWRAPQAGEPLVLPFPDLDDDAGLAPMIVPPPLGTSGSGMANGVSLQSGSPTNGEPLAGKLVFTGSPRIQSPRQMH
mmetsp:Transcript_41662/g.76259  ORF Transcript_41662/g.76259 Transcript_41662/m.76259 type:complete len:589 (+) Transcript_41662:84-1850(+)